jgi:hypothetical protein
MKWRRRIAQPQVPNRSIPAFNSSPSKQEFATREMRRNGQFALHHFFAAHDRDGSRRDQSAASEYGPLHFTEQTSEQGKIGSEKNDYRKQYLIRVLAGGSRLDPLKRAK